MSKNKKNYKGTYFLSSISLTSTLVEYGISSIFVIFLMNMLHFSFDLTSETYAYYYSFAFFLPILIGYISDKYLKITTTIILGFLSMITSQIFLFLCSSLYDPSGAIQNNLILNAQTSLYILGLIFLATGTSFTSLSFTHLITLLNKDEHSKIHAYTIYYPLLNLGIIIGVIIMSVIVGDTNYHLFKWGFLTFAICLTVALISFILLKNRLLIDNEGNIVKTSPLNFDKIKNQLNTNLINKVIEKNPITKENFLKLNIIERQKLFNESLSKTEKTRLKLFLLILLFILIYRIAYSQTNISIIYFIDGYVERDIGFYSIPVQLFCIFNPILILILGLIFVKFDDKLQEKNIELGLIERMTIAILFIAVCYAVMAAIGFSIDLHVTDKINLLWMILFEIILAISELFFSVAGYTMVSELAPNNYFSLFLGIFIATRGVSTYITGIICTTFPEPNNVLYHIWNIPINGLGGFFSIFLILNIITGIIIFIYRNKFRQMHFNDFD